MNLKSPLRPVRNRFPPLWGNAARWAVLAIVLGMASFVGACGFHPLYGTSLEYGGARQIFSTIYVDPIEGERVGYDLRNSLIDNLHGAAKPVDARFRLKVTASQYLQGIAVANNAAVTRYNYTLDVTFELSDIHSNKVLKSGTEQTLSAYDVVTSPYATLVAQQDAQRRGAQDIADRISIELSAYFDKHPSAQPAK
jgi:LPS-assembly lipoprotein